MSATKKCIPYVRNHYIIEFIDYFTVSQGVLVIQVQSFKTHIIFFTKRENLRRSVPKNIIWFTGNEVRHFLMWQLT